MSEAHSDRPKIAVIGAGAWGTTLAVVAHRAGCRVSLYMRDAARAREIAATRRNVRAQPDLHLPPEIEITSAIDAACEGAAVVLMVVPSQAMRETAVRVAPLIGEATVVTATKGLERGTSLRMSQVLASVLGEGTAGRLCALSGPNLAREIAAGKPAVTVIASANSDAATRVQGYLMSPGFRCYVNEDIVGVELAGALKNVIAIGAGMADGLEAGDNAKAAFLTRGIAEIARLGIALGAQPLTFAGLAGLGDLVATCASHLSRNHRVGCELAKGKRLAEVLAGMEQVAEGVTTTEVALSLGRSLGIPLPITEQTYAVLFEGKSPEAAIAELMGREPTDEMAAFRP